MRYAARVIGSCPRQKDRILKKVITYGTFDTLHFGHIRLLERAKNLGDYLVVGLSTDEFNAGKGKTSHFSYDERKAFLEAIRFVDEVIPEHDWEQKSRDVIAHQIDTFTMGNDWVGKFDFLDEFCNVYYLSRTPAISSTLIKANMTKPDVDTD
jgi:glycerol-3-phosphate cytidylyltransferase